MGRDSGEKKLCTSGPRHVNDGRIFIKEIIPQFPELTSGGIVIPSAAALGKSFTDAKGNPTSMDSSTVYGIVTACGLKCKRNEAVTTKDIDQGHYPLPAGTYVVISRAVDHRVSPGEQSYNTWDIHEYTLPTEPKPIWVPQ